MKQHLWAIVNKDDIIKTSTIVIVPLMGNYYPDKKDNYVYYESLAIFRTRQQARDILRIANSDNKHKIIKINSIFNIDEI